MRGEKKAPVRSRMSSRGQVVLPKEIREALGLQPGTYLDVRIEDGGIILRPVDFDATGVLDGRHPDDDDPVEREAEQRHDLDNDPGARREEADEGPDEFYDRAVQRADVREILRRLA